MICNSSPTSYNCLLIKITPLNMPKMKFNRIFSGTFIFDKAENNYNDTNIQCQYNEVKAIF